MDASESAIIESNYLKDIKGDINDVFESLQEQQESINETIGDVSDITSAIKPDFSDVQEWKKKSVKKIQEVDQDLDEFTSKGNEVDVGEIMHQIEAVMSQATTSKGKARFADFKGVFEIKNLGKLQDYNADKKAEIEAKIEKLNPEAKEYLEMAKADYDKGEIDKTTLEAITRGLINGGNKFLEELMKTRKTTELSEGNVKRILAWGDRHGELFIDSLTIREKQEELSRYDEGGFETEALWNINLKLNGYMYEQVIADQTGDEKARVKAEENEKKLREKYEMLTEYLIGEDEYPQIIGEPLELENGEQLNYRIDSEGYLHYKAKEGYIYYEENHKQSRADHAAGAVGKTVSLTMGGWLFGGVPALIGTGSGLGSELLSDHPANVLYVPEAGEVKTMIYREDLETGQIENLIIDSQGNNINSNKGWNEYN